MSAHRPTERKTGPRGVQHLRSVFVAVLGPLIFSLSCADTEFLIDPNISSDRGKQDNGAENELVEAVDDSEQWTPSSAFLVGPARRIGSPQELTLRVDHLESWHSTGWKGGWAQLSGPPLQFVDSASRASARIRIVTPGRYRLRYRLKRGVDTRDRELLVHWPEPAVKVDFAIHISVDGLRADAAQLLSGDPDSAFGRMIREGAYTFNARSDPDFTVTVPNHCSQLTGRPTLGAMGHGWESNGAGLESSLHTEKGAYVHSVFDVLHGAGFSGELHSSKWKFVLFDNSYGRGLDPDYQLPPHRRPLAYAVTTSNNNELMADFEQRVWSAPRPYHFLHISAPDDAGHVFGWDMNDGSMYRAAVERADHYVGQVLNVIDRSEVLRGRTVVILTADHGGINYGHSDVDVVENFRIPFMVWGPGVTPAAELYRLNAATRLNPGDAAIAADAAMQPIRNAEASNLALSMLGLPAILGSTYNAKQDLRVSDP